MMIIFIFSRNAICTYTTAATSATGLNHVKRLTAESITDSRPGASTQPNTHARLRTYACPTSSISQYYNKI